MFSKNGMHYANLKIHFCQDERFANPTLRRPKSCKKSV